MRGVEPRASGANFSFEFCTLRLLRPNSASARADARARSGNALGRRRRTLTHLGRGVPSAKRISSSTCEGFRTEKVISTPPICLRHNLANRSTAAFEQSRAAMSEETNTTPGPGPTGTAWVLVNVFTAPRDAFSALAVRPTVLLPIVALTLLNTAVIVGYYSQVDTVWLMQTMAADAGQALPPEAIEGQGGAAMMGPVMMAIGTVGGLLQVLIPLLLAAGYLTLVSLFGNDGVTFKRWLSAVAWSSMPTTIGMLSAFVNLALNDATHMRP